MERDSELRKYLERAVQLNSSDAVPYNDLAWLLATREPAQGGDPVRAVTLAEQAYKLTDSKLFSYLDTLAAAHAAAGRFPEAIATAQKAMALASAAGQTSLARQFKFGWNLLLFTGLFLLSCRRNPTAAGRQSSSWTGEFGLLNAPPEFSRILVFGGLAFGLDWMASDAYFLAL